MAVVHESARAFSHAALSREDAAKYLTRILLPELLLDSQPSLELLSKVLLAVHEQVPKDTSPLHVPESDWNGPSKPIVLGSCLEAMPLGIDAFDRIVNKHRGAYCWATNLTFAALLRALGFRISEMVSWYYKSQGKDPRISEDGWFWGAISHVILIADWPGSDGRYYVDVGLGGGGPPFPVPFKHGATITGLNPYDVWTLVNEPRPYTPTEHPPIDIIPGWTLYKRIAPPGIEIAIPVADDAPGFWNPLCHWLPHSTSLRDIEEYNFYSAAHPRASFPAFLLVTRLLPGTGGARRSLMVTAEHVQAAVEKGETPKAKVHTTGGTEGKGSEEERDVVWVEMETGKMKEHLEREWGFEF